MIEGVRMRLPVAVWKSTVATAWQAATTMTVATVTTRRLTASQKPRLPGSMAMS